MSDTPETDAAAERNIYGVACKVDVDFARKLERERNKAQEELQEWKDGAYATEHPCPNEVHCTCVPLLLSKIAALRKERDEARAEVERLRHALQRIADCDWVITLPDRMDAVRKIARDALEPASPTTKNE